MLHGTVQYIYVCVCVYMSTNIEKEHLLLKKKKKALQMDRLIQLSLRKHVNDAP